MACSTYIAIFLFSQQLSALMASKNAVDYRLHNNLALPKMAPIASECGNDVFVICKRCRELTQCIPETASNGTSSYKEKVVKTCKENESCLSGTCSVDTTSGCSPLNNVPFHCEQIGTFPDPANCTIYHFCYSSGGTSKLGHSTEFCEVDPVTGQTYGFDPKTGRCTIKLPGSRCSGNPVPLCKNDGDIGPLTANPSYYYLCLEYLNLLYPVQMICPYGGTYKVGVGCS